MSIRALTKFTRTGVHKSLANVYWPFSNRTTPIDFPHSYSVHRTITSMRLIRFQKNNAPAQIGALSEDGKSFVPLDHLPSNDMIELIKSQASTDRVQDALKSAQWTPLSDDIKLLAPIQNPEKIVCIGLNYLGHCQEQNKEAPKEPMFFSKFASAITGPTGDVISHEPTKVSLLETAEGPGINSNLHKFFFWLLCLVATWLGGWISRNYRRRGKKGEQSKCLRSCIRIQCSTRYFGTRLAKNQKWRPISNWQIYGHILPVGTINRS